MCYLWAVYHVWCVCHVWAVSRHHDTHTIEHTHKHTHTHTNTITHDECLEQSVQTHTATHCNTLQHTATHCNTLQHTATHCNTLHHTASWQLCSHIIAVSMCLMTPIGVVFYVLHFSASWHTHDRTHRHHQWCACHIWYRVAKTHRIPYLYRSFSAKEPYI